VFEVLAIGRNFGGPEYGCGCGIICYQCSESAYSVNVGVCIWEHWQTYRSTGRAAGTGSSTTSVDCDLLRTIGMDVSKKIRMVAPKLEMILCSWKDLRHLHMHNYNVPRLQKPSRAFDFDFVNCNLATGTN